MSNIEDIYNYVMKTPDNTNPAVLTSLLKKVANLVPVKFKNQSDVEITAQSGAFARMIEGNLGLCDYDKAQYVVPLIDIMAGAGADGTIVYEFSFKLSTQLVISQVVVNGAVVNPDNKGVYGYSSLTYPKNITIEIYTER